MDASRLRLGSAFEWTIAVAFLCATFGVGFLIVRELGVVRAPATRPPPAPVVPADQPVPALPAVLPAGAMSVPVLLLLDGKEIRVGDSLDKVNALVGPGAQRSSQTVQSGPLGERFVHEYEHAGTRFLLVFEPFERGGPPRVATIYLR